jgi:hypothetical protein
VHCAFPVFAPCEIEHDPPLAEDTEQLAVPLSGGAPVATAEHELPYTGLVPCFADGGEPVEQKLPPPPVEQFEVEVFVAVLPALHDWCWPWYVEQDVLFVLVVEHEFVCPAAELALHPVAPFVLPVML